MLETLASAIEAEIGAIMEDIDRVQVGLHVFDFLGNAVLAEADSQLAVAMPGECALLSLCTQQVYVMTALCANTPALK